MSQFDAPTGTVHYQLDGPVSAPVLVLLNSLGTTIDLWRQEVPVLRRYFRVLRYDYPGHGASAPRQGALSLESFGDDLRALLDRLGIERASLCGLSMGGMIGLSVAARFPGRVEGLVAACASTDMSPSEYWMDRAAKVRSGGLEPIRDQLLGRWFSPGFSEAQPAVVARFGDQLTEVEPRSYAAACEALAAADLTDQLGAIEAPTMIMAGALDPAIPASRAFELQSHIRGASLGVLADAAHLINVEQPERFLAAVLDQLSGGQQGRGLASRRRVLGDDHVDRALAGATPFTADFQDLITRYAWGEVWARPGLDRITRRCITIALLVSLGRWDELEMHVRAAALEDLTSEEIAEVLLHTAIYCGVPAANAAFEHAQHALDSESPRG